MVGIFTFEVWDAAGHGASRLPKGAGTPAVAGICLAAVQSFTVPDKGKRVCS